MKLFVNDVPVKIKRMEKEFRKDFDLILDATKDPELTQLTFNGHILIWNSSCTQIEKVFKKMKDKKLKKLQSLTFAVDDKESSVHFLKGQFNVIKAAGGVVVKNEKILFIYRLDKWDLPKGKLEKKESPAEGALREVEEECNVKVKLDHKIGSTWHTYTLNGKRILKKTSWYKMQCLNDSKMKPQKEEDIHDIKWLKEEEVPKALENSYASIREVIKKYYVKEAETRLEKVDREAGSI